MVSGVVSACLPSRLSNLLPAAATVVALLAGSPAVAREANLPPDVIARSALPREAVATERLIRAGGPFPNAKDGTVFGNRERLLPRQPRGYWREYTVPTPGVRHRGARRIVCGGTPPTAPEACYYSADHYASFKRIAP